MRPRLAALCDDTHAQAAINGSANLVASVLQTGHPRAITQHGYIYDENARYNSSLHTSTSLSAQTRFRTFKSPDGDSGLDIPP